MTSYLIDTNVLSEFSKPRPSESVLGWLESRGSERLFVSVVSLGEMRLGVEILPSGKRRAELEDWLEYRLPEWFASNLLPVTAEIADRWARMTAEARRRGSPLSITDGIIAATAVEHGLTVVTRNTRDFAHLGVTLVNPWLLQQ